MEIEKTFFTDVQQRIERYVQDRMLLLKLQAAEQAAEFSPKLILGVVLSFIGFFIVLFASILLGNYLTMITGSFYIGFGIILFLYVLLFILVIVLYKKHFKKIITNQVVKMFFSGTKEEVENVS